MTVDRHRFDSDRGVSTVADVTMALLLISASVALVGYAITDANRDSSGNGANQNPTVTAGSNDDIDGISATRATAVLSESTISVTYGLEDVRNEPQFTEPVVTNEQTYVRTDHGSPLGLLADAAIANQRLDGEPILAYGEEYEAAVDWAIRQTLLGTERNVYVIAEWEPYDGAHVNGTATAGERPPADADISSTTTTVPSGFGSVDETELEEQWTDTNESWIPRPGDGWWVGLDGHSAITATASAESSEASSGRSVDDESYEAAGSVIGEELVAGLFPPAESQYALEDQGIDRALKVYHYQSMVDAIGDFSFRNPDTHPPLARSEARAEDANRRVLKGQTGGYDATDADALAAWIAADLPRAFADEFDAIDEQYSGTERTERKLETVLEALSLDDVTITVQTWQE